MLYMYFLVVKKVNNENSSIHGVRTKLAVSYKVKYAYDIRNFIKC